MERRERRVRWELVGIFLILGVIVAVAFFAQRSKMLEERDRMRLEEIMNIRIGLQQYYEERRTFPEMIPDAVKRIGEYRYHCVKDNEGGCVDYNLRFTLEYGSGQYGKGEYVADREEIRFVQ